MKYEVSPHINVGRVTSYMQANTKNRRRDSRGRSATSDSERKKRHWMEPSYRPESQLNLLGTQTMHIEDRDAVLYGHPCHRKRGKRNCILPSKSDGAPMGKLRQKI